ncbi:MAG: hypothetical protein A4S09_12925 [Proteobacteria bacterium SG_bin7]|nr:MAG: hypothetical protein A4S09_12925 [Proteobacteria bacterium SG_bin7]
MFRTINLAPLKYLYINDCYGGPISNFMSKPKYIRPGEMGFEAYVQIRSDLLPKSDDCRIYGNFTGTGSHKKRYLAHYKAISEALERWAAHEYSKMPDYGFDVEPSSTGVAAYPSMFPIMARRIAFFEAVERWSLISWWHGNLKATQITDGLRGVEGLEILTPWSNESSTVILYTKCGKNFRMAYGFASHTDRISAIKKAEIELYRNMYLLNEISLENVPDLKNKNERRLLFFSSEEGQLHFAELVKKSYSVRNSANVPKLIVDRELEGPWSKYCFVWRILFENANNSHLSNDIDQFYF